MVNQSLLIKEDILDLVSKREWRSRHLFGELDLEDQDWVIDTLLERSNFRSLNFIKFHLSPSQLDRSIYVCISCLFSFSLPRNEREKCVYAFCCFCVCRGLISEYHGFIEDWVRTILEFQSDESFIAREALGTISLLRV